MNQRGNALVLGIIIGMILMGAIVGAYYLGVQKNQLVYNTTQTQSSTEISTKTVLPSPTMKPSNLKTYTNSRYGFSFEYPSEWTVSEEPGIINTSETNVHLKFEDKQVLGVYAAIPPMGCGPTDPSTTKRSTFQIGSQTFEAENFCGEKTSFILSTVNKDNKTMDVWVMFVTTPQEELGRAVLKSMKGLTVTQ